MRLIDADVAEKMLRSYADEVGCQRGEYELANGILKSVCYLENIPTAYDSDKVVEQLKDHAIEFEAFGQCSDYVELSHAIDIVKGGGTDG